MKRQFKPNNKVNHYKNKAKRYLAIGKWHEQMHRNSKELNGIIQGKFESKNKEHEALYSQFHGLRNEFIEQKTELWKVNKENEQLKEQVENQADLIKIYLKDNGENIVEIIELEKELSLTKTWLMNTSIGLSVLAVIEAVRYFI